jgi:hypothetical protein
MSQSGERSGETATRSRVASRRIERMRRGKEQRQVGVAVAPTAVARGKKSTADETPGHVIRTIHMPRTSRRLVPRGVVF